MDTPRRFVSIASVALLLASTSATPFARGPRVPKSAQGPGEACALLAAGDAGKALEVSSKPGRRLMEADPRGCVWSDDPGASDSSRRVVLVIVSPRAFQIAMHPAIATIKVEPVNGVGDEAFYQLYPNASPFIWVRKGNSAFSLRILTSIKPRPFTIDEEKSKELVLAKAAVAKL